MSDTAEIQRAAFQAGAQWQREKCGHYGGWGIGEKTEAEAERRYPHVDIEIAPSGRWYRVIGHWGELRGFCTEGEARIGIGPGSWIGIKAGDEAAVARLLNRMAERRGAA